ncbi:hypothetical protein ACPCDX_08250 [Streptomyces koyangensis]|uniref:hypothetical protein n=1 Tax=Streptomyces koyangensis TaxID=188770 RepID=UPI003C2B1406
MSRREPGDRYFEALEADRRGRQEERDAAEDRYPRDLAVVRVLSLMPPMVLRRIPRVHPDSATRGERGT